MNPHFSLSLTCLGGYSTLQALVYLSGFHPQQKLNFKLTYCTQESEDEKNLHGELRFHQSRLSGHTVDCPSLEPCDLDHSGWRRNTGGRRKRQRSYKNLQTIFSRSDLSRYVGVPRIWLWWRWRGRRPRQGPWCFLCNTKTFPSHQMYLLTPSLLSLWHGFSLLSSSSPPIMTLNPPPWAALPSQSPCHLCRLSEHWYINYIANTILTSPLLFGLRSLQFLRKLVAKSGLRMNSSDSLLTRLSFIWDLGS